MWKQGLYTYIKVELDEHFPNDLRIMWKMRNPKPSCGKCSTEVQNLTYFPKAFFYYFAELSV
jgi:hypothetical protein